MFILKHLKTLQHVSIIIQIIFRELVSSLLKSLILKFVKNVKSRCGDAAACCRITTHVPLATEPGISLIILTPMKILQEYVPCVRNEKECVCSVCL